MRRQCWWVLSKQFPRISTIQAINDTTNAQPTCTHAYLHCVSTDGHVLSVGVVQSPLALSLPEERAQNLALQGLLHLEGREEHRLVVEHELVELLGIKVLFLVLELLQLSADSAEWMQGCARIHGENWRSMQETDKEVVIQERRLLTLWRARLFSSRSFRRCLGSS